MGWLKRRLGVKGGSYIKRWREDGIPDARLEDVEQAIAELMDTAKEPPPEERLDVKLDIALWALNVSLEEQTDLLVRRAHGEAWPPRSTDDEPPAGDAQSANAPQGPAARRGR